MSDPVIDPIRDLLCSLNANLAEMGIDERLIFACDVPVTIAWDGKKHESTVRVHFTDTGLHIPNPEAQARRLVEVVKEFERKANEQKSVE